MNIILVDTSVWVNFFKGNSTRSSLHLKQSLSNTLVATCPTIVQEVLQGVRLDQDFAKIKSMFDETMQLREDQYQLSIESAILYRKLRSVGVTIRKPNDCLIATYAIKNNLAVLHDDKDFDFIAANSELRIVKP
ncbi:type II toxin-antitoxin system VapC family toxin [Mucilaginibacter paludis]|uniref:Ribonuclease VapC n=1 Tax=Mucilaginibacter paludis DSM 18603 TaxID=714943 RepID=H1YF16_9SPHI|nr:PIN domain nuclease [Mucilaginibacter paludis]EHQ25269.1 PilT protein domain protein [Mucilaginibacter paludis DSM 18603]